MTDTDTIHVFADTGGGVAWIEATTPDGETYDYEVEAGGPAPDVFQRVLDGLTAMDGISRTYAGHERAPMGQGYYVTGERVA